MITRVGLGLLPWPVTQKYDLSKPPLVTSGLTPPQASVGDRVGGIIIANSSFALSSTFNSKSFTMKCLRFNHSFRSNISEAEMRMSDSFICLPRTELVESPNLFLTLFHLIYLAVFVQKC